MSSITAQFKTTVMRVIGVTAWVCVPIMVIELLALAGARSYLIQFGIMPRDTGTLWHIFTAPFIHGSVQHCIGNLSIMAVLVALLAWRSVRAFWMVSIIVISLGGFGVWMLGRPVLHVGASGWIFGLWAFAITSAVYLRHFKDVLIGVLVAALYWGMIAGLAVNAERISIESHWFGMIAGVVSAMWMSAPKWRSKWRRRFGL